MAKDLHYTNIAYRPLQFVEDLGGRKCYVQPKVCKNSYQFFDCDEHVSELTKYYHLTAKHHDLNNFDRNRWVVMENH